MSDLIASPLGDYRVEGVIGQTVIGAMYRGAHVHLGTPVTLVVIDNRYAGSAGFKARLMQYAQQTVGFSHAHVIKTFLCGEQMAFNYVVMEAMDGGALKALPGAASWSPGNWLAVTFVQQAAQGLAAAQVRGLTHGDLKLSNLLLTSSDMTKAQVKVSELGLRQLAGEPAVTSDLVGLGSVLYEAITGHPALHASRAEFPSGTPEELKTVVRRCVSDDPRAGFGSMDELAQLLDRLIREANTAMAQQIPRAPTAGLAPPAPAPAAPLPNPGVTPGTWPNSGIALRTEYKAPDPPKLRWAPPSHPDPLPAGDLVPCLHVFDDSHAPVARQFVRGTAITIGRDADNTIVLQHLDVSGRHARVEWDGRQRITVTDLTSKNGTKYKNEKLLAEVPQDWGEEQWVRIGPYWLCLQRPTKGDERRNEGIEVILDPQSRRMELTPGKTAHCRLTLVNRKTTVEQLSLAVQGIPAEWVQVQGEKEPQVLAYERAEVTLNVTVPRSPSAKAGDYAVTIVARPIRTADVSGSATAQWTVLPFEDIAVTMSPARAGGLRQARYNLTVHHGGNFPASYALTGTDDERQLEYLFSADDYIDRRRLELKNLEPGPKNIKLKVHAPKRWFGSSKGFPFTVQAAAVDTTKQSATTEGQFQHRAIFPIWVMAVAPVLLLGLLFVLPSLFKPVVTGVYFTPENPLTDQQVELYWEASRAGTIRIFVNEVPVKPEPDSDATRYVFPKGFTRESRVRVLASNLFGSASKEVPVTPTPRPAEQIPAAEITLFTVTPLTISRPDTPVQIRWRAAKAERVDLAPIGTVDLQGTTSHVAPGEQVYTLTAYNKANVPTTRTVTVRLRGGPSSPGELSLTIVSGIRKNRDGELEGRVQQAIIFQWAAKNAQMARLEAAGSAVTLQGSSGQQRATLLGKGLYQFTLVAMNDSGQEIRSMPVVIKGTCSTSIFSEIATLGKAGCREQPEVQW